VIVHREGRERQRRKKRGRKDRVPAVLIDVPPGWARMVTTKKKR